MKRALLALALLATACGSGGDRYLPKFAPPTTLTTTNGPVTFAVSPDGRVFYAELRTNQLFAAPDHRLVATLPDKPDSLAVDSDNHVYAATRTKAHRVRVFRDDQLVWDGPISRTPAHLALTPGGLVVGVGPNLRQLPSRRVISRGWTDPVPTAGRGNRIWVADNEPPGGKERVGRGREKSVSKRNRFASVLPASTNPAGMVAVNDELLVCSKTHKRVYRLHIGIDDVARRRDWMPGLVCDRDLAVDVRGRLYAATNGAIYRYVRR